MSRDRASSFRKAFIYAKIATEYLLDCARESPNSNLGRSCKKYNERLQWVISDFITSNPQSPALAAFNKEINGDPLFHEAIAEKCLKLPPEAKEVIEHLLNQLLAGETLIIDTDKNRAHDTA